MASTPREPPRPILPIGMDDVWARVEAEFRRQGKNQTQFAQKLGLGRQAVAMWKTRGVPQEQYPNIAAALGKTIDWVAFGDPKNGRPDPTNLSAMAMRLAQEFDLIQDQKRQIDAFAKIITIITQSRA